MSFIRVEAESHPLLHACVLPYTSSGRKTVCLHVERPGSNSFVISFLSYLFLCLSGVKISCLPERDGTAFHFLHGKGTLAVCICVFLSVADNTQSG